MALLELELSSGRKIELCALFETGTYSGLLEGSPCARLNRYLIDTFRQEARRLFYDAPTLVIDAETRIEDGEEILPECVCLGYFESSAISNNGLCHTSHLAIIWFEFDGAERISSRNRDAIHNVDWNAVAVDVDVD